MARLPAGPMVLLLCACSGIAVDMDYDRDARFEDLKTFAWLKPKATGNPRIDVVIEAFSYLVSPHQVI